MTQHDGVQVRTRGDRTLRLRFEADLGPFDDASQALVAFLDGVVVDGRDRHRVALVAEELAVNAIRHGGPPDEGGARRIAIAARVTDDEIELAIEDDGGPFDPLRDPLQPLPATLEAAPIGGLGLRLVRGLTDRLEYQRVEGCNRVVATFVRRRAQGA